MRRHRLRLLDDGVGGTLERRAAEHRAARSVRPAPERDGVGIALHEAHVLERHAEPVGDELRIRRGMALPVRVRAGDDGHHAARVETELHALVEDAGVLEVVDKRATAEPAARFTLLFSLWVTRPVGELERAIREPAEFARVVGPADSSADSP